MKTKKLKTVFFLFIAILPFNYLYSKVISKEVWINKSFYDCVINSKSIYNCMLVNHNLLAFLVQHIDSNNIKIMVTDMHDSGDEHLNTFSGKNNKVYWAMKKNSKYKYEIISEDSILHNGTLYIKMSANADDFKVIGNEFSQKILNGIYYDVITKDTITIDTPNLLRNGKIEYTFKIGTDFIEMTFDYIRFNFSQNVPFEKSAYCFSYKDDTLVIKEIINKEDELLPGKTIKYSLKRIITK